MMERERETENLANEKVRERES